MNRIAELRKDRGLSQAELAQNINIAQNTLSQYENGKRTLPIRIIDRLTAFFGVTPNYLLGLPEVSKYSSRSLLDVTLVKELYKSEDVNFYLKLGWKLIHVGLDTSIIEGEGYSHPVYIIGFWGNPDETLDDIPSGGREWAPDTEFDGWECET